MTSAIPEVFVLWHPRCDAGELLARRIHAWLRPGNGLGPQVFYRSLAAPGAPEGGLPPPLPGEMRPGAELLPNGSPGTSRISNLQVVLLLIDDHLVADAAWRHWLARLATAAEAPGRRVIMPVALDSTAFNVPAPLRELNFLRPRGLPLPAATAATFDDALQSVARSLLKQLTESLCRLMLGQPQPAPGGNGGASAAIDAVQPKIMIFLSHAKGDGAGPAKRIRDYIYSQTQLAAFYDENDIPFGSVFSRVLQSGVGTEAAAMIVVRSATYASRPWCRRELSLFRRPVREATEAGPCERWRLNPTVVVDALEAGSQSAGIAELGNAHLIRWSDERSALEEEVITTALRDTMLAAFHSALGRTVPNEPDCLILNWLPDPTTLLRIPSIRSAQAELRVFYPGRGLSGLELDTLDEVFPRIAFHSFDQALS